MLWVISNAPCLTCWKLFGSLVPAIYNRTPCARVHDLSCSHYHIFTKVQVVKKEWYCWGANLNLNSNLNPRNSTRYWTDDVYMMPDDIYKFERLAINWMTNYINYFLFRVFILFIIMVLIILLCDFWLPFRNTSMYWSVMYLSHTGLVVN